MNPQKLKEARKKKGWTLKELSRRTGIALEQISRYENGVNKPSAGTIKDLANALGVKQESLMDVFPTVSGEDKMLLKSNFEKLLTSEMSETEVKTINEVIELILFRKTVRSLQ